MSYHPILTPAQLLDMQIDLLTRVQNPAGFQRKMIAGVLADRGLDTMGTGYVDKATIGATASSMSAHLPIAIERAEAFYVTSDLAAEVMRRGMDEEYMPPNRMFDHNDAPVPAGFVYIEGGLPTHEVRGREEKIHWIVWGPVTATVVEELDGKRASQRAERALAVWMFNDTMDPDDIAKEMRADGEMDAIFQRDMGRYFFQGGEAYINGSPAGPAKKTIPSNREEEYRKNSVVNLGAFPALPEGDLWWTNTGRLIFALWDLLNETVSVVSHGDANLNRATVRRARRMNLPGRVTVVKLRRTKYVDREYLGTTCVDWQHKWLVRRHRRWQACGPGRAERRLIWIEAHEKGPEHKPLIVTQKVYRLDR